MTNYKTLLKNAPTPLIDGRQVTFLWEGETAPRLFGDAWGWEDDAHAGVPLTRLEKGVWGFSDSLPRDVYVEYHFRDDQGYLLDPRNPRSCSNGLGSFNNFFYMPAGKPSEWTLERKDVPHGEITRFRLEAEPLIVPARRDVWLYRPPVEAATPLLVVLDGRDYFQRGRICVTVDNLIAAGRIEPIALAMVDCSRSARFMEYACSDLTVAFLWKHVLPLARRHLRLKDEEQQPGVHGVMGSSMGGLMSVYTSARLPQVFGRALSQSGAFEIWDLNPVVWDVIERNRPDVRIWLDNGRMDFLYRANLKFKKFLQGLDFPFGYQVYPGAHNQTSWRNALWKGLTWLFPAQGI